MGFGCSPRQNTFCLVFMSRHVADVVESPLFTRKYTIDKVNFGNLIQSKCRNLGKLLIFPYSSKVVLRVKVHTH